ncbi:thiopeptide-type bacteriocin biosynthesis protein [Bacteroidota bacterium]
MRDVQETTKRTFVIGDEWIYYKLYCGPKTADEVLAEVIKPISEELLKNKIIDKWFFIRYSDPKLHIRLRFHYTNPENVAVIINTVNKHIEPYIEQDLVNKIQIDTYQRELERYGIKSIELAEELFFHDSEMIVNFLDMIEGDEGEVIRWLFALRAIDTLLDDFVYEEVKKLELLDGLKEGFGKEFGMNKMLKFQLDKKFRDSRQLINDIFKNKFGDEDIQLLINVLNEKSERIKSIVLEILKKEKENTLELSLNELMGSYIHMLMNRLFKSKQRLHEMVVYDFLYRYYKSEIAKKKFKPKVENAV